MATGSSYGGVMTIATQETMYNNGQAVYFQHADPSGMSSRVTQADGSGFWIQGMEHSPAEFDPFGGNVGIRNPYTGQGSPNEPPPELQNSRGQAYEDSDNHIAGQRRTCQMDGMRVPCSTTERAMENDATAVEFRVRGRYYHLPVINYGAGLFRIPTEIAFKGNEVGNSTKYASDSRSLVWDVREQQNRCDFRLARIFGDKDAVMATANEPSTLLNANGTRMFVAGMDRTTDANGKVNTRESPVTELPSQAIYTCPKIAAISVRRHLPSAVRSERSKNNPLDCAHKRWRSAVLLRWRSTRLIQVRAEANRAM